MQINLPVNKSLWIYEPRFPYFCDFVKNEREEFSSTVEGCVFFNASFKIDGCLNLCPSEIPAPGSLPRAFSSPSNSRRMLCFLLWSLHRVASHAVAFRGTSPLKTTAWEAMHRADESQLARNSCPRLRFSVWSLSSRCHAKFSTQYQPCRNLSHFYFWLIRSVTDPVYTCSISFAVPCLLFASK